MRTVSSFTSRQARDFGRNNLFGFCSTLLLFTVLSGSWAAPARAGLPPVENTMCILDQPGAPNNLNCTANDVQLSSPFVTQDDLCDFPGDTTTLNIDFDVTITASQRYDLALWFSVDGDPNGDGSETGTCSVAVLPDGWILDTTPTQPTPPPIINANFDTDVDGDMCGDVSQVGENNDNTATVNTPQVIDAFLGKITLDCVDSDNDGFLDVPVIISWKNQSNNDCTVATEALPGTAAKCSADNSLLIPVPIPGRITVDKVTVPADATNFNFHLHGPDSLITGGFDGDEDFALDDADPVFDTAMFMGGLPAAPGGTAYSVTENANASYLTVGACVSDVDGTNTDPSSILLRPGETVDCTFTNTALAPAYTIVKSVTDVDGGGAGVSVDAAGDVISYEIVVTNTDNVTLTGVSVSDSLLGGLTGPTESGTANGDLDVGENWSYTGSYAATQGDLDNNGGGDGDIDNTATVSSNELPDDSDSVSVVVAPRIIPQVIPVPASSVWTLLLLTLMLLATGWYFRPAHVREF